MEVEPVVDSRRLNGEINGRKQTMTWNGESNVENDGKANPKKKEEKESLGSSVSLPYLMKSVRELDFHCVCILMMDRPQRMTMKASPSMLLSEIFVEGASELACGTIYYAELLIIMTIGPIYFTPRLRLPSSTCSLHRWPLPLPSPFS